MAHFTITSCLVKKLVCEVFNKQTCQGSTCHFFPSTRANKTLGKFVKVTTLCSPPWAAAFPPVLCLLHCVDRCRCCYFMPTNWTNKREDQLMWYLTFRLNPVYDQALNNLGNLLKVRNETTKIGTTGLEIRGKDDVLKSSCISATAESTAECAGRSFEPCITEAGTMACHNNIFIWRTEASCTKPKRCWRGPWKRG